MAATNRERVTRAMDLLSAGLLPFIEREMKAEYGKNWEDRARESVSLHAVGDDGIKWDAAACLKVMWDEWNTVFRTTLGHTERSLVSELREFRNRWAHQDAFNTDDAHRVLDSASRLLHAVSAPEADEADEQRHQLLRVQFDKQAEWKRRQASQTVIEGQAPAGLLPWREIVTPHPDVLHGTYTQAEFAADLRLVHANKGSSEYRDPEEFYGRTYLTDGITRLIENALKRITGKGGDPVVNLETNFGGGKTHSMLALYHLFSGVATQKLHGIDNIVSRLDMGELPTVTRAVFVGTGRSPAEVSKKDDGTKVRTMWGEIAWQLGGYDLVAEADAHGVSPGADALEEVLQRAAPCIILIDEWVAFVRQVYKKDGLPGGSFESNATFAQALTEAAKAVPNALLVMSLPQSDIETGGEGGEEFLLRLRNVVGRIDSPWRPATQEESYEIVRRRLFQQISEKGKPVARDAVIQKFMEMYRSQSSDFPSGVKEKDYQRRMETAYPIHPELFDRLYSDWGSLERFQRTRGILRLMAWVIHVLWQRSDHSLLILPAMLPIDDDQVRSELTKYLEDNWRPVIETDVDGPSALSLELDAKNPTYGRYSAVRRVARTIYIGSAPRHNATSRGIDEQRVKLGCVQPGETPTTFGDAMRHLSDRATHLYVESGSYWFSTQPSLTRLAQDRADQLIGEPERVHQEIADRLDDARAHRGDFHRVHPMPGSSGDIPDERGVALAILGPEHAHTLNDDASPALKEASRLLAERGNSPRQNRNTLVFLAPDRNRLNDLEQAVRWHLAWQSIWVEKDDRPMDGQQRKQLEQRCSGANDAVESRIPEAFQWLLIPFQKWNEKENSPEPKVYWRALRLNGSGELASRASAKLRQEELLITDWAGTLLRMEMDRVPLWREQNHVKTSQLIDDFARYLYLPRLRDPDVLRKAVANGIRNEDWEKDTFAIADAWSEEDQRYIGLRAGANASYSLERDVLVVKPEVAAEQLRSEREASVDQPDLPAPGGTSEVGPGGVRDDGGSTYKPEPVVDDGAAKATSFHGSVKLDSQRVARDAGQIATEVIQHLTSLLGSDVRVSLEVHADVPDGVSEQVVRTVTENCRTLGFESYGFEEE